MEEFKEKQTNRKEIYNGRVIDVVCDDVILQDGKASKRELEEECGLVADTWESLGFIYSSPGILSEKLYLYKATNLKQTQQHLDEGEFLSVSKFNIDNVLGMIKENRINDAKTICAVSLGKLF